MLAYQSYECCSARNIGQNSLSKRAAAWLVCVPRSVSPFGLRYCLYDDPVPIDLEQAGIRPELPHRSLSGPVSAELKICHIVTLSGPDPFSTGVWSMFRYGGVQVQKVERKPHRGRDVF